jgi:iron complex transport system substrate-binding protein
MLALGVTPYGVADIPNYNLWVNEPKLPDSVIDIGCVRPNPNCSDQDETVVSVLVGRIRPVEETMARIAPGAVSPSATVKSRWPWRKIRFQRDGAASERRGAAKQHLDEFDALIDSLKPRFAHRGDRPLLMVTLLDARHMLVFGKNCLFQEVLDSFGIRNAWDGEMTFWGSTVGIDPPGGISRCGCAVF